MSLSSRMGTANSVGDLERSPERLVRRVMGALARNRVPHSNGQPAYRSRTSRQHGVDMSTPRHLLDTYSPSMSGTPAATWATKTALLLPKGTCEGFTEMERRWTMSARFESERSSSESLRTLGRLLPFSRNHARHYGCSPCVA